MMVSLRSSGPYVSAFVAGALIWMAPHAAFSQPSRQFTCSPAPAASHAVLLSAATRYIASSGVATPTTAAPAYGFDLTASPTTFAGGACSSRQPFFFSVAVPDGNYQVTLTLGSSVTSTTTVRAESRRLFIDRKLIAGGGSVLVVFNVNVRTPRIDGPTSAGAVPPAIVRLKPREIGALDWDEKLTLEFNGENPGFRSIAIRPIKDVSTIYLAGDSTVVDQDKEPWTAWGQMLPVFFGPRISIANEAESGETIRSFVSEGRLAKIMSTIRPGDTLMIQFAHNDQKPGAGYVPAATDYKTYLLRYITQARAHGAAVVLVTSMNRRRFDAEGKIVQTLGEYPAAMRQVAKEQNVPLIDLNAISAVLFETMGPVGTLKAFVHYPANTFPGQDEELKDDTHFNAYGAYELARAIVQSLRDQRHPLAGYLTGNIPRFDPARPDAVESFTLPQSPMISTDKPDGR